MADMDVQKVLAYLPHRFHLDIIEHTSVLKFSGFPACNLEAAMEHNTLPFSQRKVDWIFVGFFLINFFFITYIVDIEQIIIPDPSHFQQPLWPPASMVNLIHWYGNAFDPLLMARPVWWKMTIWIDSLFYGPFYAFAIYAFIRGRDWIRIPAIFYSGMMFTGVVVILGEEVAGPHATPHLPLVLGLAAQ